MVEIKGLALKSGKYIVENINSKDLAQKLVDRKNNIDVEWVFSYESSLVKPLSCKHWVQWVYGALDYDVGVIHIFLDNILKAYGLFGDKTNIEQWLTLEFTRNLVHELIHFLSPELSEWQVERATAKLMVAYESLRFPETPEVVVQFSGAKPTTLLLTENNKGEK